MQFIYLALFTSALFGLASSLLAKNRGRNATIWFLVGYLLLPFALLLLIVLPKKAQAAQAQSASETKVPSDEFHQEAALPAEGPDFPLPRVKKIPRNLKLKWFCVNLDAETNINGPMSLDELRRYIHENKITETTYIWCEELEDWTPINEFSNSAILLDPDFLDT